MDDTNGSMPADEPHGISMHTALAPEDEWLIHQRLRQVRDEMACEQEQRSAQQPAAEH